MEDQEENLNLEIKEQRGQPLHFYVAVNCSVCVDCMKDFIVVKDPQVAKLFADPNRRGILHNLRHQEMTPCQLAKLLGKNVSSITYHLNALEKAGLVKQVRTAVKGNLVEKFYRATAEKFVISYTLSEGLVPGSRDIADWSKETSKGAVESLGVFGYDVPEDAEERLLGFVDRYSTLRKRAYEEVISQQRKPVHVTRPSLGLLLSLLTSLRLDQNPQYARVLQDLRAELKS